MGAGLLEEESEREELAEEELEGKGGRMRGE